MTGNAAPAVRAVAAGAEVVVMDDGFQNPGLAKDLSIVVVDAWGFGNGRVMPAGPLREPVGEGLARAGAVLAIGTDTARARLMEDWPQLADLPLLAGRIAPGPGAAGEQVVQGLWPVAHHHQPVGDVGLGERDPGELEVVGVVFHQQDFALVHPPASRSGTAGSSMWNTLPWPGTDSAHRRPPWRWMISWAIASPIPWPPPSSSACRRWNGSKMRAA